MLQSKDIWICSGGGGMLLDISTLDMKSGRYFRPFLFFVFVFFKEKLVYYTTSICFLPWIKKGYFSKNIRFVY